MSYMSISKYFQRIERIDQLIRLRATGPPKELAEKLKISEALLYETLSVMKEYGASIYYNKCICSYYYAEPGFFQFNFRKKEYE